MRLLLIATVVALAAAEFTTWLDVDNHHHPKPKPSASLFSAVLGSDMVMQQAPAISAVFGASNGTVKVTVAVKGGPSYTVSAKSEQGQWKAPLRPHAAHTEVSIKAESTEGHGITSTLENVIFGDVWYCGGQSNMALPLLHTMSRNTSIKTIAAGKYNGTFRIAQMHSNMNAELPWQTLETSIEDDAKNFLTFSGTCFYFGESLVESGANGGAPLGLIHTAWGGSTIEQWISNATRHTCKNTTDNGSDQEWWDSRVLPYADMTIKGWLWYQGENDMHGYFGNSEMGTGYSCQIEAMVREWRSLWSKTPKTTDPNAPFGFVTLCPSGSEGGNDIGTMRWAQTASYGVVPNKALPNTFFAQGYDLGDPYSNITCYRKGCCQTPPKEPSCMPSCQGYCESLAGTNYYMGPIHPRDKKPVGMRLATAAARTVYGKSGPATGPTLSGCKKEGNTITVTFNKELLGDDKVDVRKYIPGTSKMTVLVNSSAFCMQTSGRGSRSVCIDDGYGHNTGGGDFDGDKTWVEVDIKAAGASSLVVDLTNSKGIAYGIRYAWQGDCCSERPPTSAPCPVASCPIMSSKHNLPANPFMAKIENNKCKCIAPQVCDE